MLPKELPMRKKSFIFEDQKKFYNKLQSEHEPEAMGNVLAIEFYYMKNILVLMIPVESTFYLRHLTVNVSYIHEKIKLKYMFTMRARPEKAQTRSALLFMTTYLRSQVKLKKYNCVCFPTTVAA